jgi:hypothetical protein
MTAYFEAIHLVDYRLGQQIPVEAPTAEAPNLEFRCAAVVWVGLRNTYVRWEWPKRPSKGVDPATIARLHAQVS